MVAALESQPACGSPEKRGGCERHPWHGQLYLRDRFLSSAVLVATNNRTAMLVSLLSHLPDLEDLVSQLVSLAPRVSVKVWCAE